MSKYLDINIKESKTGKTQIVEVYSKKHKDLLGIIKWHGAWRQHVFFPEKETLFSIDCLETIQDYIDYCRECWLIKKGFLKDNSNDNR